MVNSQVINEIVDALKLDIQVDKIPNPVPVVEVGIKKVKNLIIASANKATSGSQTVYTTPIEQDFYLCGIDYGLIKDAASDISTGVLTISINSGGAFKYFYVPIITLTAQVYNKVITFEHPLKLDRGSNISFNGNFTLGVCVRSCSIWGYIDETS